MRNLKTRRYDAAEHLRTPEEMAACREARPEEANGDALRQWPVKPPHFSGALGTI